MQITQFTLAKGAIWTSASFTISQAIRFAINVALTRLLAPELFGIMVIVNTLRTGVELLSDVVGVAKALSLTKMRRIPDFYNTAWTITSIRGLFLWLIACGVATPAAHFYRTQSLESIVPAATFVLVLSGFTLPTQFLLQKRMQFARLSLFGLFNLVLWATAQIALAYFFPTIWALVAGLLLGSAIGLVTSYFMIPGQCYRFTISRKYTSQILHFGKWIILTSTVFFFAMSFDRLYFARVIPLSLLGVYGISRTISELMSTLATRLGNAVVFPFISSHSHFPRADFYQQLKPIRLKFLLISAFGFSVAASFVDLAIKTILDQRYAAAAWIVPILIFGAWISVFCSLNESTLLGFGQPRYAAFGSAAKLIWLLIALPVGFNYLGFVGCVVIIAISDIFRYIAALIGQTRERFAFATQDFMITLLMLFLVAIFEFLRWVLGFGTSLESLPIFR